MSGMTGVTPAWTLDSKSFDSRQRAQVPYLFVYGILKRGKSLDLRKHFCKFLGEAVLPEANLYRIGAGVGLKLEPGSQGEVHGEVFEIPDGLWHWLDSIENNGRVYTRKIVIAYQECTDPLSIDDWLPLKCWVYEHNSHFRPEERIVNGIYEGDYEC